ncbi:MAG: N-acetylneuraminate synthase family protein [Gammaproteobacteria bacterium]|nr:N-acetylneuraminate synthase family protein [Gammaproteobacteria bacterium]
MSAMDSSTIARIKLGDRFIGPSEPVYVIAEIGSNHRQDLQLAKELIDAASEAGADAAKFQSLKFDALYLEDRTTPEFREFFRQIELSEAWYGELAEHCRKRNIHFLSAPTYPDAVALLLRQQVPAFKIASAQFHLYPEVVAAAAATGRPMFMSTGISGYSEIDATLRLCREQGNHNLVLLHCVSQYPTPADQTNLRLIDTYRRAFGCLTGFSDHSLGIHMPCAAVALGAVVIEKHITLDRSAPGPDHHFAIEPTEFTAMVKAVHAVEQGLGDGVRAPLNAEESDFRDAITFKWIAGKDIDIGEPVTRAHLELRRAEGGIPRDMLEHLLRHRLRVAKTAGELLTWKDLDYAGDI